MFRRSGRWRRRSQAAAGSAAPSRDRTMPDLTALPPFPAKIPGGLSAVDPRAIGSYVGVQVVAVTSLAMANAVPDAATPGHPLGALVNGQRDAGRARLRASGMNEDQIEMVDSAISDSVTQQRGTRGTSCSPPGTRRRCRSTRSVGATVISPVTKRSTTARSAAEAPGVHLNGRVHGIPEAHYETYRLGGVVVAMGREHEAVVKVASLTPGHPEGTLAALAALGSGRSKAERRTGAERVGGRPGEVAEDRGFEPLRELPQHAFQACAIGH